MILDTVLNSFCKKFQLTKREEEILGLMAQQNIALKDLSEKLSTSPNTIRNQLLSIFDKTKTTSKADLLALLLKEMSKGQIIMGSVRPPIIYFIDDEVELVNLLALYTQNNWGFESYKFTCPLEAMDALRGVIPDIIVSDIKMPKMDGITFLKEVRRQYLFHPALIFLSGNPDLTKGPDLLDMGAMAVLEKPVDFDHLKKLILDYYTHCLWDRNRYQRNECAGKLGLTSKLEIEVKNIGHGGLYAVTNENILNEELSQIELGKPFAFQFSIDDSEEYMIEAIGKIVWKKSLDNNKGEGFGIQFVEILNDKYKILLDYLLCKRISSFIPSK